MNRYLIANWKMNVPPEGIGAYLDVLGGAAGGAAVCRGYCRERTDRASPAKFGSGSR